ncbi:MarR family winged helix-turn-helix transcriptional regulator [Heyndrickxia sp. MSNUG]|uniref:MarR family winged helix-turn-helix transcriptional regulator n=1 Tax=Heyndrickxia sp. MSNUG TaxID=3136677 RepID=UPI003C2FD50C
MNKEALETIELELAILIRRLTSVSTDKRKTSLDRSGYLLLRRLSALGPAGVKVLADEFDLDISTVSRQARALEDKKYVKKIPDSQDGRSYFYQITESGYAELTANQMSRLDSITNLLSDWTDDDRESLGYLLKKFNHSLKNR